MFYSDFRLSDVVKKFSLVSRAEARLFADRPPVQPSAHLVETLRRYAPLGLASANEKARSEFIVAPILAELAYLREAVVGLYSGVDLSVDAASGLTGTCDFLLTLGPQQLFVVAPVVALVEAKKEDLAGGLGQCAAEMLGARLFNERAGNTIPTVYGAVTSGTAWQFLRLADSTLSVDLDEYGVHEVGRILGILASMVLPQGQA